MYIGSSVYQVYFSHLKAAFDVIEFIGFDALTGFIVFINLILFVAFRDFIPSRLSLYAASNQATNQGVNGTILDSLLGFPNLTYLKLIVAFFEADIS